jgi:hypothetical protein
MKMDCFFGKIFYFKLLMVQRLYLRLEVMSINVSEEMSTVAIVVSCFKKCSDTALFVLIDCVPVLESCWLAGYSSRKFYQINCYESCSVHRYAASSS